MTETISDKELARRVMNGERPKAVNIGPDCWLVLPPHPKASPYDE
jgi:hypothetical protein